MSLINAVNLLCLSHYCVLCLKMKDLDFRDMPLFLCDMLELRRL